MVAVRRDGLRVASSRSQFEPDLAYKDGSRVARTRLIADLVKGTRVAL